MDFRFTRRTATIATVAYADVFDFPLTARELRIWMVMDTLVPQKLREVVHEHGYHFLKGRTHLIRVRRERAEFQEEKWQIARRAAALLSKIPTVQLVGVTGGLAMNNARAEDDIDLFLITTQGTLWVSRLITTVLMDAFRLRRHPNDRSVANKVCLNMFMAPKYVVGVSWGLDIPHAERDLFSAHEVLQMQPLFVRGLSYSKFLHANEWVSAYLPAAWNEKAERASGLDGPDKGIIRMIIAWLFRFLEQPSKAIQLWYMASHRTKEVITDTALRFHPKDARVWIRRKLAARLATYHIPLDRVFYTR